MNMLAVICRYDVKIGVYVDDITSFVTFVEGTVETISTIPLGYNHRNTQDVFIDSCSIIAKCC